MKQRYRHIINGFSRQSLTAQVVYFEVILIILVGLTIWIVYTNTTKQIIEQNQRYVNDIADQMVNNVNTHLVGVENIMYTTTYNRDVRDFLACDSPLETFYIARKIDAYMAQMSNRKKELKNIVIMGKNGKEYNTGYDGHTVERLRELNNKVTDSINAQYLGTVIWEKTSHLVFGNKIYGLDRNFRKLGNVLLLIEENILIDELSSESGHFYIIEPDGEIVASHNKKEIGTKVNLKEVTVSRDKWYIKDMNLRLVGINTNKNITQGIKKTWSFYNIIIAVMVFMVVITYLFFTHYAVKPLHKINRFISVISRGDLRFLKKRIETSGPKEIRSIGKEINELLDEVNLLTGRLVNTTTNLYDAELSKKKAELSFLKSQINPHFLYNTLGTIKGIALMHDEKEIEVISDALVKIFRYSIKGEDEVDFFLELEVAKAYIHIQQHRFMERFDVVYHIEDHLMDMSIIKMILQPVIENAIVHGIEPVEDFCIITIDAVENETEVRISVQDNGAGMTEERLCYLQTQLEEELVGEWQQEHIGILNVHRRLRYAYGKKAGIVIDSQEGIGTTVSLVIPSDQI